MRQVKFNKPWVMIAALIIIAMLGAVAACSSSPSVTTTPPSTTAISSSPTASAAATTPPSSTPSPSAPSSPSSTASPTGNAVTINLVAQNIAYNMSTITVPAGAAVTINFDNKDSGIPHNFSVYTDSSANKAIFTGQIITGPATTTYHFTAPSTPGTYFFRCDVHPTIMTGQFIVQ